MPSITLDPRLADPDFLRLVGLGLKHREAQGMQRTPADQALYDACLIDRALFATSFFPHLCGTTFSMMHQAIFTRRAAQHGLRNLREAIAAPRGSAKTTIEGFIEVIHDIVYGLERFIAIFSHTGSLADDRVKQIRDELETNARLIEVYGPQVGPLWNVGDLITANGIRLRAASPGTQLRGILQKGSRLTKILLDDFENPEHVLSELQRQKTSQRFFADIMKLGQPDTNVQIIGTILHPQSLLATLMDNPGFTSFKYKAVLTWPEASALPLWQGWREIFVDLGNPRRQEDARAFFDAHAEAMLKGTEVLWPERESYYDLMVMRLVEGERAFWLEKMNEPLGDENYLFDMEDVAYFTTTPLGIVRGPGTLIPWVDLVQIGAFWDPVPPKHDVSGSDYACCCIVGQDRSGYLFVLDCYIEQQVSMDAQMDAIVDLCTRWDCKLIGIESNGFQGVLPGLLREKLAERALAEGERDFQGTLVAIVNTRNKVQRIRTLEPLLNNGWLQMAKGLPTEFYRQFKEFLPIDDAGKDDACDAVEGAIRVVKGLYERRDVV